MIVINDCVFLSYSHELLMHKYIWNKTKHFSIIIILSLKIIFTDINVNGVEWVFCVINVSFPVVFLHCLSSNMIVILYLHVIMPGDDRDGGRKVCILMDALGFDRIRLHQGNKW